MIDRRDPDYYSVRRARMDEAGRRFKAGEISQDVYCAELFCLGFRGSEIRAEMIENWPDPATRPAHHGGFVSRNGFVSGLPERNEALR
jgi:hypothetical protein